MAAAQVHDDLKATEERILAAAATLFQQNGYSRTKVVDIARAAGITPPTLYWHFESKADILYAFLHESLEDFLGQIAAATAGIDDPAEALARFVAAHTRAQLSQLSQAHAFMSMTYSPTQLASALSKDRYEAVREMHRRHVDQCHDLIGRGVEQGVFDVPDLTAVTFAVLNIAEYTATWFRPDGRLEVEDVAQMNADFALRIVAASPPTRRHSRKRVTNNARR